VVKTDFLRVHQLFSLGKNEWGEAGFCQSAGLVFIKDKDLALCRRDGNRRVTAGLYIIQFV
jgi:hypothetical protein